jgi:hypothetical protein
MIRNLTVSAVPQIKNYAPSLTANWSSGYHYATGRRTKTSDLGVIHTDTKETCCVKES